MEQKIRNILREIYGGFNSQLEHEYELVITKALMEEDFVGKHEWVTYNQVVLELKHNLKDSMTLMELQYKLTDKVNPTNACIEVLEKLRDRSPELDRLYHKIRNFK